jgi:hypothetical protein
MGMESLFMETRSTYVSSSTEGTLYIDLIDAKKKKLVWQGRRWLFD